MYIDEKAMTAMSEGGWSCNLSKEAILEVFEMV